MLCKKNEIYFVVSLFGGKSYRKWPNMVGTLMFVWPRFLSQFLRLTALVFEFICDLYAAKLKRLRYPCPGIVKSKELHCHISLECSSYTFLMESSRARTYYNRSIPSLCDANISGWYRLSGKAGGQMALSCVNKGHCGTDAPRWLIGAHPTVDDGVVQHEVCFSSFGNCCYYSTKINVRNCEGFYVYRLQRPPHCYLRYCGSGLP